MAFSLGCRGQPLVVGENRDLSGSLGGSSLSGGPDLGQQCPDLAVLRTGDTNCWPTRHVGRWHGFVTSPALYQDALENLFAYPSNDVLLVIDQTGTGSVTFANAAAAEELGDAGPDADAALCNAGADAARCGPEDAGTQLTPETDSDAGKAGEGLVDDFAYTLSQLRMSGGANDERKLDPRVDFWISPAQPHLPARATSVDGAESTPAPERDAGTASDALQASLSLSEDGNALRGTLTSERADHTLSTGFELIRQ